jgi:membrane protease YdiL (CAAX protease family)
MVVGEEIDWRGFALPRLLQRYSPVAASLLLGVLWAYWHASMFWIPGTPLALVIANTLALSFVHTWIFTHARQSIFVAILFHALNNTTSIFLTNTFSFYSTSQVGWSVNLVYWLFVFGLLLFAKPYRLIERFAPRKPPNEPSMIP